MSVCRRSCAVMLTAIMLLSLLSCDAETAETEAFTFLSTEAVPEEELTDASVYHWAMPTVFRHTEALVTAEVSNEAFLAACGEGAPGAADRIIVRNRVEEDETVCIGSFRLTEEGEYVKICTKPECRADPEAACEHLNLGVHDKASIWYDGCAYMIGTTVGPDRSWGTSRFMILKWEDGADSFEKLFETDRVIRGLYVTNGILYADAPNNTAAGAWGYYAIDLAGLVYTFIPTEHGSYVFGDTHIVEIDRMGGASWRTDRLLARTDRLPAGGNLRSFTVGEEYWTLDETSHILYRTDLRTPAKAEVVMERVRDFLVIKAPSDESQAAAGTLYYIPCTEEEPQTLFFYRRVKNDNGVKILYDPLVPFQRYGNRQLYMATLYENGVVGEGELVYRHGEAEWLWCVGDMNGHAPVGKLPILRTYVPGNETYVKYFVKEYAMVEGHLRYMGIYAQPSDMD